MFTIQPFFQLSLFIIFLLLIVAGNGHPPVDGVLAETVPLGSVLIARLHDPVSQFLLPPTLSRSFSSLQQLGELLERRRWDFVIRQVTVSQVFQDGVDYLFIFIKCIFFHPLDSYLTFRLAFLQIIRFNCYFACCVFALIFLKSSSPFSPKSFLGCFCLIC